MGHRTNFDCFSVVEDEVQVAIGLKDLFEDEGKEFVVLDIVRRKVELGTTFANWHPRSVLSSRTY